MLWAPLGNHDNVTRDQISHSRRPPNTRPGLLRPARYRHRGDVNPPAYGIAGTFPCKNPEDRPPGSRGPGALIRRGHGGSGHSQVCLACGPPRRSRGGLNPPEPNAARPTFAWPCPARGRSTARGLRGGSARTSRAASGELVSTSTATRTTRPGASRAGSLTSPPGGTNAAASYTVTPLHRIKPGQLTSLPLQHPERLPSISCSRSQPSLHGWPPDCAGTDRETVAGTCGGACPCGAGLRVCSTANGCGPSPPR